MCLMYHIRNFSKSKRTSSNLRSSPNHKPFASQRLQPTPLPEVILKALKGVPYKRQRHLGRLVLFRRRGGLEPAVDLHRVGGLLLEVLGGEVGRVDVGREARLKGGAEAAQVVEVDAREEGVAFELLGPAAPQAVLAVADEAVWRVRWKWREEVGAFLPVFGGTFLGRGEGVEEWMSLVCGCVGVCVRAGARRTFGSGARRSGLLEHRRGNRDNAAS